MKQIKFLLLFSLVLLAGFIHAQTPAKTYSLLIKGGHVIDAKNKINEVMDVAIQNGKIAAVAKNIDAGLSAQLVDATGMYVTPGLVDLHAHVFAGTEPNHSYSNGTSALAPDGYTFRSGVTTVVDCGGAGWKSFPAFKKNVIDNSRTRVLSFLNIVGEGMRGDPHEQNVSDMNPKKAAETALANKDIIVGFKLAHFAAESWIPVERVLEAGKTANMPVIIDFGGDETHPPLSIEKLFTQYLRSGDIYTHVYTELSRRDPIVDLKTRQLRPFVIPAQKKGIIFDVGFGGGSFNFNQAIPAIKAGLLPNTMGTDLHIGSMNGAMKDQLNVLSIFLAMGMDIQGVISRSTWAPAQAINHPELGNLSVGGIADVAVLGIREGKFGFKDIAGNRQEGKQKFECEMTIKGGSIVYDLNARANTSGVR
jgi:dihydroorotase